MHDETESQIVANVANAVFGNSFSIDSISRLSLGRVNWTFLVNEKFIFRIGADTNSQAVFAKEQWCISQASASGIPVPEIVGTGLFENSPFMIQNRLPGQPGTEIREGYEKMWQSLGDYSRRLATISLDRFGKHFMNDQVPAVESWDAWVSAQVQILFPTDDRIWKKLFNRRSLLRLKTAVQGLTDIGSQPPVLAHGDMSEYNVIVEPEGKCYLIDWGDAGGFPLHWDVAQVCAWHEPGHSSILAFCDGYGISPAQLAELQPWLKRVRTWRWMSSIRWSMDQQDWMQKDFVQLSLKRLRLELAQR